MSDCNKCGATGDEICMCDTDDSIDLGACLGCFDNPPVQNGLCMRCFLDECDDEDEC